MIRFFLTPLILLMPGLVVAAPWCLHMDTRVDCIYRSEDACYSAISGVGGKCLPNPREMGDRGYSTYCLITARERNCGFLTLRKCMRAVETYDYGSAGCVENTQKFLELKQEGNRGKSMSDFLIQGNE